MSGHLAIGDSVTCRTGFGFLPPGRAAGHLGFQARAFAGASAGCIDLPPEDILAASPFGRAVPPPVPTLRLSAVAAPVLPLLLSGLLILRRARRS